MGACKLSHWGFVPLVFVAAFSGPITATEPEKQAPDYKTLFERANASAAAWKEKADQLDALLAFEKEKSENAQRRLRELATNQPRIQLDPPKSVSPPTPASTPAIATYRAQALQPTTIRATVSEKRWYHLVRLGGPNIHLSLIQAEMTFISVQYQRGAFPTRINIDSNGRALIHNDMLGCRTYYVHDPMRKPNTGVLEFEHTSDSLYHPYRSRTGMPYSIAPER